MKKYTIKQRIEILEIWFTNGKCNRETARNYNKKHRSRIPLAESTVRRMTAKFLETGSLQDDNDGRTGRPTIQKEETVERVKEYFEEQPETSQKRASLELDISRSTLRRIVKTKLGMFPYKIQIQHFIPEKDISRRFNFANEMINMKEDGKIDFKTIWFSDEAHFYLSGYVNKQNYRYWGTENPHLTVTKPLHPLKVTVWCALSASGLIGPYFFEKTITSDAYKAVLDQYFVPTAHGMNGIDGYFFMQDGARPHRTSKVFEVISEHFDDRIIGLDSLKHTGNGMDWPPYSPDLNPLDFYLWGCLKDKVYRVAPKTIAELKEAIGREMEAIGVETLEKVIEEFEKRLLHVVASSGDHFENLIS